MATFVVTQETIRGFDRVAIVRVLSAPVEARDTADAICRFLDEPGHAETTMPFLRTRYDVRKVTAKTRNAIPAIPG